MFLNLATLWSLAYHLCANYTILYPTLFKIARLSNVNIDIEAVMHRAHNRLAKLSRYDLCECKSAVCTTELIAILFFSLAALNSFLSRHINKRALSTCTPKNQNR